VECCFEVMYVYIDRGLRNWTKPFVCLFVVIKPENPYLASCLGLEVNPPGVYPFAPRSSSCGPTNGAPPPRTTLRAN